MKQHTIKRLFGRGVLGVALLAAAACTGNFEEYNTKPYRPTDEDLVGDNVGIGILFPSMMEWMTHYQVNASQYQDVLIGDELGGYCSAVKPYQGQNISTYNPSDSFNDPLFNNTFSNFYGNYFQVLSSTGGRRGRLSAGPDHPRGLDAPRDRRLRSDSLLEDAERNLLGAL